MPHSTIATDSGARGPVGEVPLDQSLRPGLDAVAGGELARDAERVEAVDVASGRQDRRGTQDVAAGCGADVAAVKRVDDRAQLAVDG